MKEKTGIGVITCDRPSFLRECIKSLKPEWYDELVVVNDGFDKIMQPGMHIINNEVNLGVGKSKNKAIEFLLAKGCDHIFLVEDDVVFLDNAFAAYVAASKKTRVKHFNYCLHGQDNKQNNVPIPRKIFEIRGQRVALYFNVYGACSYYHKSVFDKIGLMDEQYVNAMEHVDHTMNAIKHGYHPPFRWFIDLENSNQYIVDQDYHHDKSTIRRGDWMKNFKNGVERFKQKHNVDVTNPGQPYDGLDKVIEYFKSL